jgi:hypothetical protein
MPEGVIKKTSNLKSKITIHKINLILLIAIILMLSGLFYYQSLPKQACTSDQVTNNIYTPSDKEVITTTNGNSDCYTVCVNQTKEGPPLSNSCIETNQQCFGNNSQCCSGCCKYNNNGEFRCLPETECVPSCRTEQQTCASTIDCCGDLICTNRICQPKCIGISERCIINTDCCSGLTCQSGLCQPPIITPVCINISGLCTSSSQCCSGLHCTGETCQP